VPEFPFVTVVSGLPRSGTSVMMQMLHAGGLPAVTDQIRTPDDDNPRGYFEFERVKQVKADKTWLPGAVGKVVKMVHMLLYDLPPEYQYRVIFMRRNLEEVVASQRVMLQRQGKLGAAIPDAQLIRIFDDQVAKVLKWLDAQPNFRTLQVVYPELIADPRGNAQRIDEFLGGGLDVDAMAGAVDPKLYRNRRTTS
jgi:hypothetical protein